MRDLRNRGGAVVDEVARGGAVVVTRDGTPVAELRPLPGPALTVRELIRRRRSLPDVDLARLRSDIDEWIDASL
ncbi:type II toxin-antitoxin system Phd/YefM family antitoxin [Propionicicella superfundia]|uniref:type II toxin-antitoxin system Phd/YefM family antitoxin n=1 Tax=Propionicicella superfundia TaxID=348582 RepID=UPI00041658AD|nr:type II toxin-antitoxin system prevent-host-death family antitoxin [Propionicicella superfundia]